MISVGDQNPARIKPRTTDPASLPAPMNPRRYLICVAIFMPVILSGAKNLAFDDGSH
jgi:hypothetical protein